MTPTERELVKGDVVQLGPNVSNPHFRLAFMTITEPRGWGAVGICHPLNTEFVGAYIRVPWGNMEYVGRAHWIPEGA